MTKYDRRDPSRATLILTRASHYLWRLLRAKLGPTVNEERAIWEALEIIWEAKREVKAQETIDRTEAFKNSSLYRSLHSDE